MTKLELENIFIKESKTLERKYSAETIKTYLSIIDKYIDSLGNKDISETTERDVRLFLYPYNKKSENTYNIHVAALRSFYDIISHSIFVDENYITNNPMGNIRMIASPKRKQTMSIDVDTYHKILNGCKNTRDYAIITCLMNLGLREHELIALTVNQYLNRDSKNGIELTVTKGSKKRTIYLNENVCNAIDNYLIDRKESRCNNLFISNGGKAMTRSCIYRTIKTCAKRGGVNNEIINNLHPHCFRASFATLAIKNGFSPAVVASAMGHSKFDVTFSHYLDDSNLGIREAMINAITL